MSDSDLKDSVDDLWCLIELIFEFYNPDKRIKYVAAKSSYEIIDRTKDDKHE